MKSLALILLLWCGVAACTKGGHDLESYGDIFSSPEGLVLTQSEHEGGWGRSECFMCHNVSLNIHRGPDSPVNADELNRIAEEQGEAYCMSCHGTNGTP